MQEIAFKVSAKAARLIGRESVSNAEGAIGELIKNTYDADANACAILFIRRFLEVPNELSQHDYNWFLNNDKFVEKAYQKDKKTGNFLRSERKLNSEESERLENLIHKLFDLWVIDNGTGMSATDIEENWMVIGTEFKEENVFSEGGRTRTGAKGIGRFALDRLGASCELYSFTENKGAVHWNVNWENFDGSGKTLDEVKAYFSEIDNDISQVWDKYDYFLGRKYDVINSHFSKRTTGTLIRISHLRDTWGQNELKRLDRSIGALIPPLEQNPLDIFLLHSISNPEYRNVAPTVIEDFDYKVEASFDGKAVDFKIHRKELIPQEIDPDVFKREDMQRNHFKRKDFKDEPLGYTKTLEDLFGELEDPDIETYSEVGKFNFTLLFFKRNVPGTKVRNIYPYRGFRGSERKSWLDEYGGIKIYRDNFVVRPYGEMGSRAFDWLGLGQRVAENPLQASRKGWRVSPQNLAGTISISRVENPNLYDQVTREGLIENRFFDRFKAILMRIIQEFEDDRSHIHHNISENYKIKNKTERRISEGAKAAKKVLKDPKKATPEDAQTLAEAVVAQSEEISELKQEQAMMRSLATLGTVLVSFSHEMGQLQSTMGTRSSELMHALDSYIGPDDGDPDRGIFHPYSILNDWAEDDKKVKQWFNFALSSVRANKRRRGWIDLIEHLESSKDNWRGFLHPRKISLQIDFEDDYRPEILAFPIDLESIFNNLLINSVEALISKRHTGKREVLISVAKENKKTAKITYSDNGPGVDPSISPISKIFDYNVTTKRDPEGNAIGTGLGMWILNTIVDEYGGNAIAYKPSDSHGFKIEIFLPTRGMK